jgi:hypothetical protein
MAGREAVQHHRSGPSHRKPLRIWLLAEGLDMSTDVEPGLIKSNSHGGVAENPASRSAANRVFRASPGTDSAMRETDRERPS